MRKRIPALIVVLMVFCGVMTGCSGVKGDYVFIGDNPRDAIFLGRYITFDGNKLNANGDSIKYKIKGDELIIFDPDSDKQKSVSFRKQEDTLIIDGVEYVSESSDVGKMYNVNIGASTTSNNLNTIFTKFLIGGGSIDTSGAILCKIGKKSESGVGISYDNQYSKDESADVLGKLLAIYQGGDTENSGGYCLVTFDETGFPLNVYWAEDLKTRFVGCYPEKTAIDNEQNIQEIFNSLK
ncbi:MAG: hypothetical protein LBM87_04460 [Ruminococcus sp.]|jgi:hypothetical protein|nr:hypothetical protein [Ruminococcus sp.]